MSKHTPGPWTIETPMGKNDLWIVEAGKPTHEWHCIALVTRDDSGDELPWPEVQANAALMAAAPEMPTRRHFLQIISCAVTARFLPIVQPVYR